MKYQKQVSMTRKYHKDTQYREEEPHNNHKHKEDKRRKATNSLFPIKTTAELERTQSNEKQNMEQTQNPLSFTFSKEQKSILKRMCCVLLVKFQDFS